MQIHTNSKTNFLYKVQGNELNDLFMLMHGEYFIDQEFVILVIEYYLNSVKNINKCLHGVLSKY